MFVARILEQPLLSFKKNPVGLNLCQVNLVRHAIFLCGSSIL